MVTLFSSHCPMCNTLERQLKQKGIEFTVFDDTEKFIEMGVTSVPSLKLETGEVLDFTHAMSWVRRG